MLAALAFGCSAAYYPVMTWMFHHQALLSFIFIVLALGRVMGEGAGDWDFLVAGVYCLLSALMYGMGAISWPMAVGAYLIRRMVGPARGPHYFARRLSILGSTALVFGTLYYIHVAGAGTGETPSALEALRVVSVMLGNLGYMALGVVLPRDIPRAANALGIAPSLRVPIYEGMSHLMLAGLVALTAFSWRRWVRERFRLGGDPRALMLMGWMVALMAAGLFVVVRGRAIGSIVGITYIPRYGFFPLMGLMMVLAGVIMSWWGRAGAGLRAGILVALLVVAIVQGRLLGTIVEAEGVAARERAQMVRYIEGMMQGEGPRRIGPLGGLELNGAPLMRILPAFKQEGDILLPDPSGGDYYTLLRGHEVVDASDMRLIEGTRGEAGNWIAAGGTGGTGRLVLEIEAPRGGPYRHLHFYGQARADGAGVLKCEGYGVRFEIRRGWVYKRYVQSCPGEGPMRLEIEAPGATVRDLRVY